MDSKTIVRSFLSFGEETARVEIKGMLLVKYRN